MIVVLGDDDSGRSAVRGALSFGLRIGGWRLEPSREKQNDEDDQDDAEDTDAAVSIAIAVAAEAATEPASSPRAEGGRFPTPKRPLRVAHGTGRVGW